MPTEALVVVIMVPLQLIEKQPREANSSVTLLELEI